mgnify:CR=1 FL=1|jgi:hypothetical protein
MYTVYEAYTNKYRYAGSYQTCKAWIMNHCKSIGDKKIFSTWREGKREFYDIGIVYYIKED